MNSCLPTCSSIWSSSKDLQNKHTPSPSPSTSGVTGDTLGTSFRVAKVVSGPLGASMTEEFLMDHYILQIFSPWLNDSRWTPPFFLLFGFEFTLRPSSLNRLPGCVRCKVDASNTLVGVWKRERCGEMAKNVQELSRPSTNGIYPPWKPYVAPAKICWRAWKMIFYLLNSSGARLLSNSPWKNPGRCFETHL